MTTCYARLKLYSVMEKCGDSLCYTDTDSLMFIVKKNGFCPQLGNNLGELTDEIDAKKGNYIKELILVAPKSYAYETDIGYRHALCKGITFNNLAALKINLDSMKEIVLEDKCKKIEVEQLQFIRDKKKWNMKTQVGIKKLSNTFDKRIVLENKFETLPFGF